MHHKTPSELKKYLPLMQAFAEGKTIQICFTDFNAKQKIWRDCSNDSPDWTAKASDYRIKPELKFPEVGDMYRTGKGYTIVVIIRKGNKYCCGGINKEIFSLYSNEFAHIDHLYSYLKERQAVFIKNLNNLVQF